MKRLFQKRRALSKNKDETSQRSPLEKISPLNLICPFTFHLDRVHSRHFLEIDEMQLNWTSFKKKDIF